MTFDQRVYRPSIQVWVSIDPIGFGGGSYVLYAAMANNPTNFTDPLGLQPNKAEIERRRKEIEAIQRKQQQKKPLTGDEQQKLKAWSDLQAWLRDNAYSPSGDKIVTNEDRFRAAGQRNNIPPQLIDKILDTINKVWVPGNDLPPTGHAGLDLLLKVGVTFSSGVANIRGIPRGAVGHCIRWTNEFIHLFVQPGLGGQPSAAQLNTIPGGGEQLNVTQETWGAMPHHSVIKVVFPDGTTFYIDNGTNLKKQGRKGNLFLPSEIHKTFTPPK